MGLHLLFGFGTKNRWLPWRQKQSQNDVPYIVFISSSVAVTTLPVNLPLVCSDCNTFNCDCIPCWILLRHLLIPAARLQT